MHIVLFDDTVRHSLLPFTHTRPVADIRCGVFTMRERWERLFNAPTTTCTQKYLQALFPQSDAPDALLVNAAVFATQTLVAACLSLQTGQSLVHDGVVLAARVAEVPAHGVDALPELFAGLDSIVWGEEVERLEHVWDIFSKNDFAVRSDYEWIVNGRTSAPIPDSVIVTGRERVFIEPGAIVRPCIINAETGPVYIGKDAEVMEGSIIRGPFALCDHAVLKMGAKVYGATTLGPGCKAGGEINNAVFFANSNKGHDGFVGNAVIGEWCNLGADTNCSNLKNNYGEVKIWDEHTNRSLATGLQFCGLMMADHSKCSINTMFNTGTVVGVSCNIFGSGFPEKFVPSFSWGGSDGVTTFSFDRAMDTARRMMARRNVELTDAAVDVYRHVFMQTEQQRKFFNGSN